MNPEELPPVLLGKSSLFIQNKRPLQVFRLTSQNWLLVVNYTSIESVWFMEQQQSSIIFCMYTY